MQTRTIRRTVAWTATAALGFAAAVYALWAASAWRGYGRPAPPDAAARDPVLDRFMPRYDVVERHRIRVDAPGELTFAAACEQDLTASPVVRAIFRARAIAMRADDRAVTGPRGLLAETRAMGWGMLAEIPHVEIVMGAVTRPWDPSPVFRAVAPDAFAAYDEPDAVKIVWTLRVEPDGPTRSVFYTETRAVATDAAARQKFRRYWTLASPGIWMIRRVMLGPVRADAERRARAAGPGGLTGARSSVQSTVAYATSGGGRDPYSQRP